ncbi:MAG: DUF1127 domain-containing protein [Rhodobacteraceae bacterium]|nr:DUF1127 domain-containing protein [Paracoccaceae bacterium]NDD42011.1 DUF1127 domain-containing protein [Paracoccaceae bacterium]
MWISKAFGKCGNTVQVTLKSILTVHTYAHSIRRAGLSDDKNSPVETRTPSFCLETIGTWLVRYRTRRHLSQLDNDLLRDIGLSVKAEFREARPPFWK